MQLQVGTFNVRWDSPDDGDHRWDRRRPRLVGLLRDWGPDLLGLQEPLARQRDDILRALPEYGAVGVGRDDGREAGEFCAILYRQDRFDVVDSGTFWLSETPDTPGSKGWGSRHARICSWACLADRAAGWQFFLYNVHLDHESQQARNEGVARLLERIRGRRTADPVLVTGDFNAPPDNTAVAALTAADSPTLTDAFHARHPDGAAGGTFHGFTGTPGATPIDYVFVSKEWRVLQADVVRGDGLRPFRSDHFPVAVTLALEP